MVKSSVQAAANPLSIAVFSSELGWMAVAGSQQGLRQLTFGHASPASALAALPIMATAGAIAANVMDKAIVPWHPTLIPRLQAYARGACDDFLDVPLDDHHLGPFQRLVVDHCRQIAYGATLTYGQLAALAGSPRAARAVGTTMATNCTPLVVPCHRVVAAVGLGNYSAGEGVRMKLRLLEMERGTPPVTAPLPARRKRPAASHASRL